MCLCYFQLNCVPESSEEFPDVISLECSDVTRVSTQLSQQSSHHQKFYFWNQQSFVTQFHFQVSITQVYNKFALLGLGAHLDSMFCHSPDVATVIIVLPRLGLVVQTGN